jgi:hypothetical protein
MATTSTSRSGAVGMPSPPQTRFVRRSAAASLYAVCGSFATAYAKSQALGRAATGAAEDAGSAFAVCLLRLVGRLRVSELEVGRDLGVVAQDLLRDRALEQRDEGA